MDCKMIYIVVMFGLFSICHAYTASEIYGSLTSEEKVHFLRYYIAKGVLESQQVDSGIYPGVDFPYDLPIPKELAQTFESIQIEPSNFPQTLMTDFTRKFNLTHDEALQVARKRCNCVPRDKYLCMPDGTCLDLDDVGSVCCT